MKNLILFQIYFHVHICTYLLPYIYASSHEDVWKDNEKYLSTCNSHCKKCQTVMSKSLNFTLKKLMQFKNVKVKKKLAFFPR